MRPAEPKPRIGISSCLLGQKVRYDGGHKLDTFLKYTLGKYVDYVPVCPEVECGFGTPREAFRLVGDPANPRLITSRGKIDHTDRMAEWARKRVAQLESERLCGFIFKANSPSSGMERVRVYDSHGMPHKKGAGLFARAVMDHFPLLPVEEDGRLHDARLRENFIESVFVFQRFRDTAEKKTRGRLVQFHTRHKLLLLAHCPKQYAALGKLVAAAKDRTPSELYQEYQLLLAEALRVRATPGRHINVLQHVAGYFRTQLTTNEKKELEEIARAYRCGHLPLIVPVTLVNHYARKYDQSYLREQWYLNPHPLELALRNHA